MPKPEYTESCDNCIHYTKTSYMFGQCELCRHEVACTAICTQFAERQISPEMCREAEKVPVVVEKAGTITNGDRIRAMTDEELQQFLCQISTCETCPFASFGCKVDEWLKQEAKENAEHS